MVHKTLLSGVRGKLILKFSSLNISVFVIKIGGNEAVYCTWYEVNKIMHCRQGKAEVACVCVSLGRLRLGFFYNIKVDLQEVGWEH